jgi:hypothetical protein
VGKLESKVFSKSNIQSQRFTKQPLERILGKYGGKVWTECIWLRIGTSGWLL